MQVAEDTAKALAQKDKEAILAGIVTGQQTRDTPLKQGHRLHMELKCPIPPYIAGDNAARAAHGSLAGVSVRIFTDVGGRTHSKR